MLSSGEIDERLFLGEDANIEIGTPLKSSQTSDEIDETGRYITEFFIVLEGIFVRARKAHAHFYVTLGKFFS